MPTPLTPPSDTIHIPAPAPAPHPTNPPHPTTHLLFIPGNPGILPYYTPFLTHLSSRLAAHPTTRTTAVHARSLRGFRGTAEPAAGLQAQIAFVEGVLGEVLGDGEGGRVVLVGHSVGAYLVLEVLRRRPGRAVCGAVLLFPTVVDIRMSDAGRRVDGILHLPYFAQLVGALVQLCVFFVPLRVLCWLVARLMGYPPHAAEATAGFLKGRGAVRAALHLAKDEMDSIREDMWGEEVWGEESGNTAGPKLVFYFGQNDHWVAAQTRDTLISTRSRHNKSTPSSGPTMLIDEDNIPHSFCLRGDHSEVMAEKVAGWVGEVVEERGGG